MSRGYSTMHVSHKTEHATLTVFVEVPMLLAEVK